MAWVPVMGEITVFSVYFYHTEEWTERNQQILEATSREIRRGPGLWILAGDFNMEPETVGQCATPAAPTFRHGASVRCFDLTVPPPIVGCAREPRGWDFDQSASMDERWTQLMKSTEQEILGGCDVLGAWAEEESCTCEVSQQAQDGRGNKIMDSVEHWTARALADGSPAHQTTAPASAAGAD